MSKLYDILNSVITRLKKVETTEPDWNAAEGEVGHVKNRTHYEQLDVQSHTNFVAELAPHYPDPRDGTCRLGQDIAAFALLTTAKYDSRKGGWDWNRYGVGNRRLYLYIDDTKIEIPLELITNLKSVELEETYNDHRITICGYGPSTIMLYDENNNFLQQTKGCFLMATVFGWGSETPLPNMRLVYGELELKPLNEIFIPSSIPKVQTAAVGQTVVVKAVDENGKPTEWEAADMASGGAGGSADWNASEGEAGHVKNRTHYVGEKVLQKNSITVFNRVTSAGQKVAVAVWLEDYIISKRNNIQMPDGKRFYVRFGDLKFEITELPGSVGPSVTLATFDDGYSLSYALVANPSESAKPDRNYCYLRVKTVESKANQDAKYAGTELSIEVVEPELVPLDEKYIPNSIPKVQTAAVGQTVVVKAVDENGKPTEWEAADVGWGGGNKVVAHLTPNDDTGEFACDMSFEEMLAAKQSGKQVELNCFGETFNYESHNVSYVDEVKSSMSFSALQYRNGFSLYGTMFTIYDDGSVEEKRAFLEMRDDSAPN